MPILDSEDNEVTHNDMLGVEYETYMLPSSISGAPNINYVDTSSMQQDMMQDELCIEVYDEDVGDYVPSTSIDAGVEDTRVRDYIVSHVIHCVCGYVMAMVLGYMLIMSLDPGNWYYDMVALAIFVAVLGCVYMGCIVEKSRSLNSRIRIQNT